ncbi:hypothetical protein AB0T20_17595 [Escherichia coli]
MSAIDTLREYAEVWRLFGSMPDDATLSAEVSALYLGVSVKTLARYRQTGNGPAYIQYQAEDSKARNQRVNYLLGDLKTWRDNHKVNSTMEAAQVRGLAFASLADFTKPEPFWTIDNKIYSHALTVSDEVFKELLNVSRAFKELFERKILIRDAIDNQVYLNSNLCVKGIPRRFNEDLMDKFRKSRLETEDFANSFNFYRAGSKTKPVKNPKRRYPTDGIPFD